MKKSVLVMIPLLSAMSVSFLGCGTSTPESNLPASSAPAPGPSQAPGTVPSGTRVQEGKWGVLHLKMDVTSTGADLKLECAIGKITDPLVLDSNNRFSVQGHVIQNIAPEDVLPAHFEGTVSGNTMNLRITYTDSFGRAHSDSYSPVYGETGVLERLCAQ